MIHSMTGFAAASATLGAVSLHLELRSVNFWISTFALATNCAIANRSCAPR